jgi:coproporphyrinogen III oxidase-like Fe-S oxidoreductase
MGRYDSYGSGQENIERLLLAQGQFDTINADMIFNLPGQTEDSLHEDLRILLDELSVDQVSYYPLMTSSHTAHEMKRSMGISETTNEEAYYDLIRSRLDSEYSLSSVWCFSRKQGMVDEYIISDSSFIGAGSGSFSYLDGVMYSNTFSIKRYQKFILEKGSALTAVRSLSRDEQVQYDLVMSLFGGSLNTTDMESKYNGCFSKLLWKELDFLHALGLITHDGDNIKLTRRGQYDWVVLMREFFIGVDNFRDEMRRHVGAELATLSSKTDAHSSGLHRSQASIS